MINPENLRECQCCLVDCFESDECMIFKITNEWLCRDCYAYAEKIQKKLTEELANYNIEKDEKVY